MDVSDDTELWAELGLQDAIVRPFQHCVLHIGTEKTGTTSLQNFLGVNRAALLRAGCFVPASLSPYSLAANHERLTTYALNDTKLADDLRVAAHVQNEAEVQAHRLLVVRELHDEIAQAALVPVLGARCGDTLLLSNEHCQSRLVDPTEVARLKTFLSQFADQVKVVVYLRPQHELATSLYDQALKSGYCDITVLPDFSGKTPLWVSRDFFDYDDLLQRWVDVFGRENVEVRIFARAEMRNGSIIDDFLGRMGVDTADMEFERNSNLSMSADRQATLNAVNRHAKATGKPLPPELRTSLIEQLQLTSQGPGQRPTRHEAEAFYEGFISSNERVRKQFLPERQALFTPDFSIYPEAGSGGAAEADAMATTVLAQQKTIDLLKMRLTRR